MTRRRFIGTGSAMILGAAAADTLAGCATTRALPGGAAPSGYFERFGVDDGFLAEALAAGLSRGGDRADLFFQHRLASSFTLEDGAVNSASSLVELGMGVRVVKGDQVGYAYTEELTREAVRRAALTAAAVADGPSKKAPGAFRVSEVPSRYPMRVRWEDVGPDKRVPILEGVNAAVLAADPRIKKATVTFGDETSAVLIVDSEGRKVEDLRPMTNLSVTCVAEQNGRREENGYTKALRGGLEVHTKESLDHIVKEAVRRTLVLFEAVPAAAGEMPVVLAAGASGILLHEAIGHGMEADFNKKGTSIYSDRVGKAIAKPFVTIVDDGSLPGVRGSINVDDEGNPVGKTVLVENGVLTTYLHDSISAEHYKVAPTGNGRRESYRYPPMPRMRTTYMLNGPHEKDEIIASVKKGVYCENFTNGEVKIGAGDFTFYVKNGYLIEDGKLTRPVKDVNIIGNGPKVLEQVDMVAKDFALDDRGWTCGKDGQGVPVSLGLPTIRVAAITVGGRGQKG